MKKFNENLNNFILNSTCCYTCIEEIKKELNNNGFKELKEEDNWNLKSNKYYVVRNDASIIAFEIPDASDAFSIVTTHSDTPSLQLKPSGEFTKEKYLKFNVMPYGGLLNYGWLDHALSLAGRVIVKKNGFLETKIIDFKKPLLIIPSVAIHQNDQANTNLDLNMQIDLEPILSINKNSFKDLFEEEVVDYDLFAYNLDKPVNLGIDNELFVSPRIDNLTSVYSGLISFLNSKSKNIKVFCSFNNEEIGSLTVEGADSNFLLDTLKRIAGYCNIDIATSLSNSFIVSSDNTHAIHPNHNELSDDTGKLYMGRGFAIVKEPTSTTNAISSSIIKTICNKHRIKYQEATARNDLVGGSTLSGLSLRHVSVLSIDVGIAELAMHSSVEVCALKDIEYLYKMMKAFYEAKIIKDKNKIKIS